MVNSLLSFQKNHRHEIVISLNLIPIKEKISLWIKKIFLKPFFIINNGFFRFLDLLVHRYLTLLMSLGLGIGIGLTIFGHPFLVTAIPTTDQDYQLNFVADKIIIRDQEIYSQLIKKQNILETNLNFNRQYAIQENLNSTINNSHVMVFNLSYQFFELIKNVQLGEKIILIGSNHGHYQYTVLEKKLIEKANFSKSLWSDETQVIVYSPINLLNQEYLVLIAK